LAGGTCNCKSRADYTCADGSAGAVPRFRRDGFGLMLKAVTTEADENELRGARRPKPPTMDT